MIKAHNLLKLYEFHIIVRALDSFRGSKIYSLGATFLDDIILFEQEQEKLKEQREPIKLDVVENPTQNKREDFNQDKRNVLEGL